MRLKTKKVRRLRSPLLGVARNMGKWKPQDDFLLIQSVMQLNDLEDVFKLTKFTRRFSFKELKERWYAILYDAPISRMIYKNIKKLHSDDILRLKQLAPFSDEENKLLLEADPSIAIEAYFENFLLNNRFAFHDSRTSKILENQWNLLNDLNLVKEHKSCIVEDDESLEISFNELEDQLNDNIIMEQVDLYSSNEQKEMKSSYDSILHEIKRAEADLFLWQILVDKVTDRVNPFAEIDTLAILFSEQIEFKIKKKKIMVGRSSSNSEVDVDLSLIKFDKKLSRNQFIIYHLTSNIFFLFNKANLPVFVDGSPVLINEKTKLNDKSLIEVGIISMLFLVNYNIIRDDSESILT